MILNMNLILNRIKYRTILGQIKTIKLGKSTHFEHFVVYEDDSLNFLINISILEIKIKSSHLTNVNLF